MLWIYNCFSHLQNIWNDDIGDTHPLIPITNTLKIENYDLKNDFIIQSSNTLVHKTQNFEDDGFTILSNFMIMDELEYQSMLRQSNKGQILIFDNVMYRKQMYPNIPIHIFFMGGARTSKKITLKLIIQGLLWLYNKDLSSNLTKIKALRMASTSKVTFNIDGQTIHLTFNIHVQQTLTNLSTLSSDSLNKLTCWYEQLQLNVIDEIFFVGASMFNVKDNWLRVINHIQNEFFGGLNVIMSCDFYQSPPIKDCWIFFSFNGIINALAPFFWKNNVKCFELSSVMQQINTQFIKTLNKQSEKKTQYINSNCYWQIPNILTTHLFYTNILEWKHNKFVFNKTCGPTFNFEAIDIHHHSYPSSFKLPNDSNKIASLHTIIHIKQNMVVEFCARNYATYDGLVDGANGVFKTSTFYHNKTMVWILFPNQKIEVLVKEKST